MPADQKVYFSQRARRLKALIVKEFYQIVRDPSSIMISIILPLVLMFLFGFGISLDLNHLRIGIVMEDTSPDAQSFVKSITNSKYFEPRIVRDRRELLPLITSGSIRGFVVIPAYFSKFRYNPSAIAPLQIIADGSEPNTANFVRNYVSSAFQTWLKEEQISSNLQGLPLVTAETRYWYNEQLESRYFLIPGSMAIIMTLIGTLLTALVVAREWERGTMESLMSTPVSIVEILLGKIIPYFILGMLSLAICVGLAVTLYEIPFRGSLLLFGLVSGIFLFAALGVGLFISTLSKNQFVASQIALVAAFLPSYMLSGFIFEIASMPKFIQYITYVLPARYYVTNILSLFLVGNVPELMIRNTLPVLFIGMVVYLLLARITVKRLD
jgi:ABC-2 type transport system permease protein